MSEKYKKVKEIIENQLGVDGKLITPEAMFVDDLGADSIDTIELIVAIENEFGIDIPEDKASSLKTVDQLLKYIEAAS